MSQKQPKRQRCQPKVYTDSDFRKALRDAVMSLEEHHMRLAIGCFALALHRVLHLPAEQISSTLEAVNTLSYESLCFQDVKKEVLDETGLDLEVFVEGLI